MPATVPRELMVLVERVVRPLPLPLSRQKRLRTELLEHLQGVYADELASDGDEAAALGRATARFGDPAYAAEELRATIGWREKGLSFCESLWTQRLQESTFGYARRISGWAAGTLTLFLLVMAGPGFLFLYRQGLWEELLPVACALVALVGLTALFLCVFLDRSLRLGAEWHRPAARRSHLIWHALPIVGTPALILVGSYFINPSTAGLNWMLLVNFVLVSGTMVVLGIYVGALHDRATNYRREWAELELDGG